MTRRDYILIARAISSQQPGYFGQEGTRREVAEAIADALELDNPRFERLTFLQACSVS